ncbi:hypothetical protein A2U01_0080622, partial [Trifolium medium]|nr:hypothetical protein [Trifolium medium]
VPGSEMISPVMLFFCSGEWEEGFVPAGAPMLKSAV